jgi:hypothetical protein
VARSLIRPLRKLRADALDVAGNRLPEMVRRLSQSEGADEGVEIEPIGVTSTDEIGKSRGPSTRSTARRSGWRPTRPCCAAT